MSFKNIFSQLTNLQKRKLVRAGNILAKRHKVTYKKVKSEFLEIVVPLTPNDIVSLDLTNSLQCKFLWKLVNLRLGKEISDKNSCTDFLTGLCNRRSADATLLKLIKLVNRSFFKESGKKKYLFVLTIDIDHFKKVNDQYGHDVGDKVLVAVAKTLAEHTRSTDYCARTGGEEFTIFIVSDSSNSDQVLEFSSRVRKEISSIDLKNLGINSDKVLTASIGISQYEQEDNEKTVTKRSDQALYEAKKKRDCDVFRH